jgi:hypothetical protein
MLRIVRGALLSLALILTASEAVAETRIGGVVQRDYTGAIGVRAGQGESERLFYDHDVFAEQRIKTDRDANTRLQFLDSTELTVGGNSNVLLDRFIFDPDSGAGEAALTFGKGVFRFVTGKIKTKEAVTLKTPTATIAIRGTHLILTVRYDGSAAVAVVEGAILVQACGSASALEASAGSTVEIAPVCAPPTRREGYEIPNEFQDSRSREKQGGDNGGKQSGSNRGGKGP